MNSLEAFDKIIKDGLDTPDSDLGKYAWSEEIEIIKKDLEVLEIIKKRMEYDFKREPIAGYTLVKTYSFSIDNLFSPIDEFNKIDEWMKENKK